MNNDDDKIFKAFSKLGQKKFLPRNQNTFQMNTKPNILNNETLVSFS